MSRGSKGSCFFLWASHKSLSSTSSGASEWATFPSYFFLKKFIYNLIAWRIFVFKWTQLLRDNCWLRVGKLNVSSYSISLARAIKLKETYIFTIFFFSYFVETSWDNSCSIGISDNLCLKLKKLNLTENKNYKMLLLTEEKWVSDNIGIKISSKNMFNFSCHNYMFSSH